MSLEQLRSTHEELEVYHEVLLHELSRHPRSKRQIVFQDHKLSNVGQSANKRAKLLVQLHQDKHQLLANECKELQDRQQRFTKFYQELQDINQFHASNVDLAGASLPSLISNNDAPLKNKIPPLLHVGVATGESNLELFSELDIPDSGDALVTFSGEEHFGRFVDLHTFFSRYKNLPKTNHQEITYEQYVENIFYDFSIFTSDTKSQRRYSKYITELLEYIDSFVQRTRPLSKQAEWKTEQTKTFNNAWSKGKIENWTNGQPNEITNVKQEKEDKKTTTQVDLKQYKNAVDMEVLGMDVLKAELMARGVKCGGTIRDRSDRLYSIRDLNTKDIPKHLKAKKKRIKRTRGGKKESNNSATSSTTTTSIASSTSTNQLLAMNEYFLMQRSTTTLKNEIVDTLRHLERKRTRTHEEMQREMEDELKRDDEEGADGTSALRKGDGNDSDEDNNDMLYNPKGLPLGWDGKPIPYWLYRLHGLSKSYKCEICGNHTYWGRKEFESHFQEQRHIHGMKCLKIPNTTHFHGIIGISDALSLYSKLKVTIQSNVWNGADNEEFEDSAGNIMNKASYEDLKKQGLL